MAKYIIGSDIKFVRGKGELVNHSSSATHYKNADANKFILNRKDLCSYKIRAKSSTKKDYVIGQIMYVVGNDNNIVINIDAAKQFSSCEEAVSYIKNNREVISKIDSPYIYDSTFNKIKDGASILQKILDPPLSIESEEVNKKEEEIIPTPRIKLTPTQRARVYSKSGKICALCGKPLKFDEFTVDHIKPLALGGTYDDDNLQATHEKCNRMKTDLNQDEFLDLAEIITENRMINNYNYENMLHMSRAIVRGTIANLTGLAGFTGRGLLT